jgi:hypothetical protein
LPCSSSSSSSSSSRHGTAWQCSQLHACLLHCAVGHIRAGPEHIVADLLQLIYVIPVHKPTGYSVCCQQSMQLKASSIISSLHLTGPLRPPLASAMPSFCFCCSFTRVTCRHVHTQLLSLVRASRTCPPHVAEQGIAGCIYLRHALRRLTALTHSAFHMLNKQDMGEVFNIF